MTGSVELSVVVSRTLSRSMVSLRNSSVDAFPFRTDRYYSGCSTRECRALWICGFFFRLVANTPRLHATSVYGYTSKPAPPAGPYAIGKIAVINL